MSSVNKAILVGHMGGDPEVRETGGGMVANFNVATNEKWTDKQGEKQERTEWHRVVAWGKTADFVGSYLGKGRLVYVEGRIETRKWENDGVDRYTTEIVAHKVQALDKKPAGDIDRARAAVQAKLGGGEVPF